MTTTFDNRERGFENKYVHDQELDFIVAAKAHQQFGLWVAEKMQLEGDEASEYANSIVEEGVQNNAPEKIIEKALKDLGRVELEIDPLEVKEKLQEFVEHSQKVS